jgi:hypothetical protein
MSNQDPIDWLGQSGTYYRYWILDLPRQASAIKNEGGNYIYAKQLPTGRFLPLYIGQASSLQVRIPGHEVWAEAVRLGVTHVFSHVTPAGERARCAEEADLIAFWNPPLNKQHRTAG